MYIIYTGNIEWPLINNDMTSKKKPKAAEESNPWKLDFKVKCNFDMGVVHKSFTSLLNKHDTKMVFVDGPAGTAKTYLAVYSALQMLQKGLYGEVVYIRSVVESASQKMGSLPGEVEDKFLPWSMPLVEKLDEIIGVVSRKNLMESGAVHCVPVNFVRGLTFSDSIVIVDESQNLTQGELVTILTRFGENSKFIVIGDTKQSDISGRSGFRNVYKCFNNTASEEEGIFTFKFGPNEIVRSEILKFIVAQLEDLDH